MLLQDDELIVCAWLTAPEHKLSTKKSTILPSTVKLHEKALIARHSGHPETECLKLKIGWQNLQKYQQVSLLDTQIGNGKGRLNLPGGLKDRYRFSINPLDSTQATAYYLQQEKNRAGTPVSLVEKITGENQVSLDSNSNEFKASSNLSGKQVKVRIPIYYPDVLIKKANIKLNKLDAILVIKQVNGSLRLLELKQGIVKFAQGEEGEEILFREWDKSIEHNLEQKNIANVC